MRASGKVAAGPGLRGTKNGSPARVSCTSAETVGASKPRRPLPRLNQTKARHWRGGDSGMWKLVDNF